MNWNYAIDNGRKNQTYNTPSLSGLYYLHCQLVEINKIGSEKVLELARKKADFIYSWANDKKYLAPFVGSQEHRSQSVACIDVTNEKVNADKIVEYLEKEKIVYGIEAYRKLGRNQFRISLFHNIKFEDIKKLTLLLSQIIEKNL